MLTSAADMLHIFDTVIVSADKELVDAMMSGDDAKIIAAYESPLCQNASMFVSNEATIERKDDIADIRKGGANMNTLNAIIDNSPEIQSYHSTKPENSIIKMHEFHFRLQAPRNSPKTQALLRISLRNQRF